MLKRPLCSLTLLLLLVGMAVSGQTISLPQDTPALPFDDNPDPAACGIPVAWGSTDPVRLLGVYRGELVQPVVFLYDSHLRRKVVGAVESGTYVHILLYQVNPVLNYYLVRSIDLTPVQQGWVPAHFVRLEVAD